VTYQPLSPLDVERKLRQCITDITKAEQDLRAARDVEVECELEWKSAVRRAMFHPDCPKVSRGAATVADRDAWVEAQCADEYRAYRLAKAASEAAQDRMRVTRDIAVTVQSLGALVRQAYQMAGTT